MRAQTFAVAVLTLVTTSLLASPANAADVVGDQSHEISWTKEPGGLGYQVYYGQTNTGVKDSSVAGLAQNSERLMLNHLKPCTQYTYNVLASLSGNSRKWLWKDDPTFVTGGDCGPKKLTNAPGVTLVSDVVTTKDKTGKNSSTIGWSKKAGASGYTVYYRNETSKRYDSAVKVPAEGSSLTINQLTPGMNYYYQVCATLDNKEQCYGEKMLQQKSGVKPVLGAKTTTPFNPVKAPQKAPSSKKVLGVAETERATPKTCDNNKKVTLNWGPDNNTVTKYHVVYGTKDKVWQYAVRDLSDQSRSLTVGALNSCTRYWFEVWAVSGDGKVTVTNPRVNTSL